tara:strand:- start:793 stop:1113 length:321 start_codon:yes stop_codon:yes gene_type:complete
MESIAEFQIFWTVDGTDMVGYDLDHHEVVRVNTGDSHWKFTFANHAGVGRIRVGNGCDYNPFDMIEQMRFHLLTGMSQVLTPLNIGEVEIGEDVVQFDPDFVGDWG